MKGKSLFLAGGLGLVGYVLLKNSNGANVEGSMSDNKPSWLIDTGATGQKYLPNYNMAETGKAEQEQAKINQKLDNIQKQLEQNEIKRQGEQVNREKGLSKSSSSKLLNRSINDFYNKTDINTYEGKKSLGETKAKIDNKRYADLGSGNITKGLVSATYSNSFGGSQITIVPDYAKPKDIFKTESSTKPKIENKQSSSNGFTLFGFKLR